MFNKKLKVGIVGSTGLLSGFLIKLLHKHPNVSIECLISESSPDIPIDTFHSSLRGLYNKKTEPFNISRLIENCQIIFFCKPHGQGIEQTTQIVEASDSLKLIDLSANFRLKEPCLYQEWYNFTHPFPDKLKEAVYGLPELYYNEINKARFIANPGCYPTSVILALAPLSDHDILDLNYNLSIDSYSGVSGAGKQPNIRNMAITVAENILPYKVTNHQHTPELEQEISRIFNEQITVNFVPHVMGFKYGILSTVFAKIKSKIDTKDIIEIYNKFYKNSPFIRICSAENYPEIQNVQGNNFCDIGIVYNHRTASLIIMSAIDNVIKGGVGQAIQNMNIMSGWDERLGLL